MQGILILLISFIILFFISRLTNLKPTSNYKDKFEYIPIITSNRSEIINKAFEIGIILEPTLGKINVNYDSSIDNDIRFTSLK